MKLTKFLLSLGLLLALAAPALGAQAVILPNGRTQFLDSNGDPLAGGTVGTYVPPNTLTPKTTWQDSAEGTPNSNPITLDSAGSALIYGAGAYRELVRDALGNTIFDAQTYGFDPTTVCPLTGCTFTGPVIIPTLTVGNLTVTGTTISPALYPPNYLAGCGMSNSVATPASVINIASCFAKDSTNVQSMTGAALSKDLASGWSLGNNGGCLDVGSAGDLTYHYYIIERVDTLVTDYLCSLANGTLGTVTVTVATPAVVSWPNNGMQIGSSIVFSTTGALPTGLVAGTTYYAISAGYTAGTSFEVSTSQGGAAVNTSGTQSGVHTGASSPKLPANYTLFRRIGSIPRFSGALIGFLQDGDTFSYSNGVGVLDVNTTNPGTSAILFRLSIPTGVRVEARMDVVSTNPTPLDAIGLLSDPFLTSVAPSATLAPLGNFMINGVSSTIGSELRVMTDYVSRIRGRFSASDVSLNIRVASEGWVDKRGRD